MLDNLNETILFNGQTSCGHYLIVDMIYDQRPARVLFTGNKSSAQSGIALDHDPNLLFDYNQRFLEVILSFENLRNVLLIGGGVLTLPMALISRHKTLRIDVIEIDDGLLGLARKYFHYQDNERITVMHQDGSEYLKSTLKKYDIIIIDAFMDMNIPSSLISSEVTSKIQYLLNFKGLVLVNVISAFYGLNAEPLRQLYKTYKQNFTYINIYPASRSLLSFWSSQNFILVASNNNLQDYLFIKNSPLDPNLLFINQK